LFFTNNINSGCIGMIKPLLTLLRQRKRTER
jgi:hypothetical protein